MAGMSAHIETDRQTESSLPLPVCDLEPYIQDISSVAFFHSEFSSVFLARISNRRVAIKKARVRGYDLEVKATKKHIAHEYAIWSRLKHPNILRLIGMCHLNGDYVPSFVSPFQENGEILNYLRESESSGSDLLPMLQEIADGISYLHKNGFVHGDIRADNILLSSEKVPLLADFGLSTSASDRAKEDITMAARARGNVRWTARELLKDGNGGACPHRSSASDVWSFGMTIKELLTGSRPYDEVACETNVIIKIGEGTLPDFSAVLHRQWSHHAEGLREICRQCWKLQPTERPSIEEVANNLRVLRGNAVAESSRNREWERRFSERQSEEEIIRAVSNMSVSIPTSFSRANTSAIGDNPFMQSPISSEVNRVRFASPASSRSQFYTPSTSTPVHDLSVPVEATFPTSAVPMELTLPATSSKSAYKTEILNYVARESKSDVFSIISESDGPHHAPIWHTTITFEGVEIGKAKGWRKTEAEDKASRLALKEIFAKYPPTSPTASRILAECEGDGHFVRSGLEHNLTWTYVIKGAEGSVEGSAPTKIEARQIAIAKL